MSHIAVLGAGSWGTALGCLLAKKHQVTLWGRNSGNIAVLNASRENQRFLPGITLPPALAATADLNAALSGAEFVVCALPAQSVRQVMQSIGSSLDANAIIIAASKGIELGTLCTMEEVLTLCARPIAILSGPSFAREVALGMPTAVVVASRDHVIAESAATVMRADRFRVYTSDDVEGVEIGGALKNVMAIAAGIADGLGLGLNARAALITRGLAEIGRLATARGANPLTLAGLAGLGDLVLTCTGDESRNRKLGLALGRGETLAAAIGQVKQVAEGVQTCASAHALAQRLGIEMPITAAMHRVLFEGLPAAQGLVELLSREPKRELQ